MNDIVFIHGAYHGIWCWEERFLKVFQEKGYKAHCPDLRTFLMEYKQATLFQTYVENLYRLIRNIEGRVVLVVHSAYSIVVFEYLKKYSETVTAAIFLSPLPVGLKFPRVLISGIRQLRLGRKSVFFSNRLPRKMAEKYLQKLCTEESGFTIETSKNHWKKKDEFPVPALFVGSENYNCIKAQWVRKTAEGLGCECIIYEGICHDMMLDPFAIKMADDMIHFVENIEGKES
ncbi:MAG: alpha/beta hydrolase [Roseburia sp.]